MFVQASDCDLNPNLIPPLIHHARAQVKSCIIMSELVQQDLPRAEEELVDLFDCLLKSVRYVRL